MSDTAAAAPSGITRAVTALIQHSERWGKLWFGLLFWGSVLFAAAQRVWPEGSGAALAIASFGIGLAIGAVAHARGKWL